MIARLWGIVFVVLAILMTALMIDRPALSNSQQANLVVASMPSNMPGDGLRPCDSSQGSPVGQLVPGQSLPPPETPSSEIASSSAIPKKSWSSRAGFSISSPTDPVYWAGSLGSGWYLDWNVQSDSTAFGPQHWQMVRVREDCITPSPDAIQSIAATYPGQVWIIGNEPDVIWQDNTTPSSYAVTYHDLYYLIKASDPSAQVAMGGISQATPLRFRYLDQVLKTYQDLYHQPLPTDYWTVHGYVLREEKGSWGVEIPPGIDATQGELYEVSDHGRIDLFESQLVEFRQWMAVHGYQDTPLALTEFGILMPNSYGFPPEAIAAYLEKTFAWLYQARDPSTGYPEDDYRLVQRWAWFSISDPNYPSSNLGDFSSKSPTVIGERFRNVVTSMER